MNKIRKGDTVEIISGNYRGVSGKVLKVFPKERRLIVEGVNFIKRHTKPTQKNPQGGIVEREASIDISNVMLICPKCHTRAKVKIGKIEGGKRVRICKNCEEMIDM